MASVRWQVIEAMQTAIRALNLPAPKPPATLPADAVMIRKKAEHDRAYEAQPSIVLVPLPERIFAQTFGNVALMLYPVLVLLVLMRSLRPESVRYEADTRELIRLALWKPYALTLSSGLDQDDSDYEPEPAFNAASWGESLDVTGQLFTFRVKEARSS